MRGVYSGERVVGANPNLIWNGTVARHIAFPCMKNLMVAGDGEIALDAELQGELSVAGLKGMVVSRITEFEPAEFALVTVDVDASQLPGRLSGASMALRLSPHGEGMTMVEAELQLEGSRLFLGATGPLINAGVGLGLDSFKSHAENFAQSQDPHRHYLSRIA